MNHYKYTGLFILLLVLTACSNTDSGYVNTAAINADFEVTSSGGQSDLIAQLTVGDTWSNNVLELSNGDQLIADNGSQSVVMRKDSSIFGDVKYRASFPGDSGGTRYTITFNRPSSNETIKSSITLPEDFAITSSYIDASYTDTDYLPVNWNPSSPYNTQVSLTGLCGYYITTSMSPYATGASIPLSNVIKTISGPSACTMTIDVSRNIRSPVNAQFGEGGYFSASQTRDSSFRFTYN